MSRRYFVSYLLGDRTENAEIEFPYDREISSESDVELLMASIIVRDGVGACGPPILCHLELLPGEDDASIGRSDMVSYYISYCLETKSGKGVTGHGYSMPFNLLRPITSIKDIREIEERVLELSEAKKHEITRVRVIYYRLLLS